MSEFPSMSDEVLMERIRLAQEGIPVAIALLQEKVDGIHRGLDRFFVRIKMAGRACRRRSRMLTHRRHQSMP